MYTSSIPAVRRRPSSAAALYPGTCLQKHQKGENKHVARKKKKKHSMSQGLANPPTTTSNRN